ncbi:MAG: ribbon-helix-helix domain-containing protein [Lachnospiraceae bacterium]|nr:ribbon-helix-helix domain-containing protein [Lachnospiraceae bacterium]
MRKYTNYVKVYLSDEEEKIFEDLCERSGRTKSDLIRNMITGYRLKERPGREFFEDLK